MNREEALRTLGLEEGATPSEIKIAYREMAQILHPDRFQSNKKLQSRAEEQFKNLQDAYSELTQSRRGKKTQSKTSADSSRYYSDDWARLAGVKSAKASLVRQKDALLDERRNGMYMAGFGALITLLTFRITRGPLRSITGIASAVCIWGIVQIISTQRSINTINDHLNDLAEEQKIIEEKLDIEDED